MFVDWKPPDLLYPIITDTLTYFLRVSLQLMLLLLPALLNWILSGLGAEQWSIGALEQLEVMAGESPWLWQTNAGFAKSVLMSWDLVPRIVDSEVRIVCPTGKVMGDIRGIRGGVTAWREKLKNALLVFRPVLSDCFCLAYVLLLFFPVVDYLYN